jgi:hypothetical protein
MPSGVINGGGAVRIKPEPDVDVQIKSEPVNRESEAAARAAQNLKSAFGVRASGSIQAIHRAQPGKPGQPGQPAGPQQGQMPYPQPLLPQMPQYPPQTDGAGDEADEDGSETEEMDELDTVMMRCGPDGSLEELGRVDIDRMLHKRMMAHAQAMEGGGLMVPLKKVSRRTRRSEAAARSSLARPRRGSGVGKAQLDGGDYDDDDEDAINSDLDDPNEFTEDEDEEDDQLTNAMLCMYEYVAAGVLPTLSAVVQANSSSARSSASRTSGMPFFFSFTYLSPYVAQTSMTDASAGSAPSRTARSLSMARSMSSTRPLASTSGEGCLRGRRCPRAEAIGLVYRKHV